jgi:hypothetical protein
MTTQRAIDMTPIWGLTDQQWLEIRTEDANVGFEFCPLNPSQAEIVYNHCRNTKINMFRRFNGL